MIRKTEAIVLNTHKFRDTSLICTMYTRLYGRQSYLIKGYRSTKGKKRHGYFQPMSIIEVVFFFKETRSLQIVSETSNAYFYQDLQTNPIKITLGMVITEVFYHSVKEEERNDKLFVFLHHILVALDTHDEHLIHYFIFFLIHLTRYLGFFPRSQIEKTNSFVYFNLAEGTLENASGICTSDYLVGHFCEANLENCHLIKFGNHEKSELINSLLQYYQLHVEGFKYPESMKVLAEVFS